MDNALLVTLAVIGIIGLANMIAAMTIIVIAWTNLVRGFRQHHEMVDQRLRGRMSAPRRPLPNQGSSGSK